jgi:hypothetical protein
VPSVASISTTSKRSNTVTISLSSSNLHAPLAEQNSGDGHRATTQAHAFLESLTILPIDTNGYILSQNSGEAGGESTITARALVRDKAGWIHA